MNTLNSVLFEGVVVDFVQYAEGEHLAVVRGKREYRDEETDGIKVKETNAPIYFDGRFAESKLVSIMTGKITNYPGVRVIGYIGSLPGQYNIVIMAEHVEVMGRMA